MYTVGDCLVANKTTTWRVSKRTVFIEGRSYEIKMINHGDAPIYVLTCEYFETVRLSPSLMQECFGKDHPNARYNYAMDIL